MALVQPEVVFASPPAGEADLKAYDALLGGASRLRLRLVTKRHLAWTTFRVDVDGARDAFSILVHFDRNPSHEGKNLVNKEPLGAFVADVVLGDGTDGGRVVQTVWHDGGGDGVYTTKDAPAM